MKGKKVIIAGATGLVGTELTTLCLENKGIDEVTIVVRRRIGIDHPKLKQLFVDYEKLPPETFPKADVMFCCLGTTLKKAGSKEAFKKVDFDYVLKLAHVCMEKKIPAFHVVSSMGADPLAKVFYSRVKGNMEKYLQEKIKLPTIFIYRPSMLFGNRDEFRLGEKIGIFFMKVFSIFIPKKYKGIEAKAVAKTMLKKALSETKGTHIITSDEMRENTQAKS